MGHRSDGVLKIAVISYDAGGAELISSLVANEKDNYRWSIIASDDSPAKTIFTKKSLTDLFVHRVKEDNPETILTGLSPDYLFCGTGANKFEWPYIRAAKNQSICTIAFLDHWVNYRERFGYPNKDWRNNLTDFIAVADNRAFQIANKFKDFNLIKTKNYYISDLISDNDQNIRRPAQRSALLFISEAIEEQCQQRFGNPCHLGYTQTDVLTDILLNFKKISKQHGIDRITVRLHPFEPKNKFFDLRNRYPDIDITIENAGDRKLNDSIKDAKMVIGINSMALLIAYVMKKQVISYIPVDKKCTLPLPPECCINNIDELENITTIKKQSGRRKLTFYRKPEIKQMLDTIGLRKNENSRHNRSQDDLEKASRQGFTSISG
jgi:hypothetical protein